jgi:hypothetical protein
VGVLVVVGGCGGIAAVPATDAGDDGRGLGAGDATLDVTTDALDATDGADASDSADALEEGPFAPVACQNRTCDPRTQACCVTFHGGEDPPPPSWDCVAQGTCTGASTLDDLGCWAAANCASGDVCCRSAPTKTLVSTCSTQCASGDMQLCASPAECPSGQQCSTDPGGWRLCATPCIDGENVGFPAASTTSDGTIWVITQYNSTQDFTLSSIRLYTDGQAGDAGTGQVAILGSTTFDASTFQPGAVLATGTLPMTNVPQWNTAPVSPPVSIVHGSVYFIGQKVQRLSMAMGGTSTDSYEAPSLAGPWSGPFTGYALLAQTCQ